MPPRRATAGRDGVKRGKLYPEQGQVGGCNPGSPGGEARCPALGSAARAAGRPAAEMDGHLRGPGNRAAGQNSAYRSPRRHSSRVLDPTVRARAPARFLRPVQTGVGLCTRWHNESESSIGAPIPCTHGKNAAPGPRFGRFLRPVVEIDRILTERSADSSVVATRCKNVVHGDEMGGGQSSSGRKMCAAVQALQIGVAVSRSPRGMASRRSGKRHSTS